MRRRWEVWALWYEAPVLVQRCWTKRGAENVCLSRTVAGWRTGPEYEVRERQDAS